MKRLTYVFLAGVLFSMLMVVSCGNEFARDDFSKPEISGVRFTASANDTIVLYDTIWNEVEAEKYKLDTLHVVLSELVENDVLKRDILVVGYNVLFSGTFDDDKGLSSSVIRIWGDTLLALQKDTCYRLRIVPSLQMFEKTKFEVENILLSKDAIPAKITRPYPVAELPVRTEEEKYTFSVFCTDIAGNQDKMSYSGDENSKKRYLRILSSKELLQAWKDYKED